MGPGLARDLPRRGQRQERAVPLRRHADPDQRRQRRRRSAPATRRSRQPGCESATRARPTAATSSRRRSACSSTAAPARSTALDFQVNDGTGGARTSIRNWADPTGLGYQSTARWGVVKLVDADARVPIAAAIASLRGASTPSQPVPTAIDELERALGPALLVRRDPPARAKGDDVFDHLAAAVTSSASVFARGRTRTPRRRWRPTRRGGATARTDRRRGSLRRRHREQASAPVRRRRRLRRRGMYDNAVRRYGKAWALAT